MSDEQPQDTTFQDNLAVLYMSFSIPSILGSVYIMQDVLRSKKRRASVFHRIMVGMASIDMIYGLYTLFGPIVLPGPDELDGFIINSYARGSWAAYNAISYFGQTARIASILYNGTLTMYYLLTLRFRWTEGRAKQQAETWFHIIPITAGLVVATVAISLGMFKDTPFGCTVAIQDSDDEQKKSYNLIVFICLVWLVFIEIFVSMVMIYRSIRKTEQNANKWRMPSSSNLVTKSGSNKSLTRDLSKSSLKSFFEEANNAAASSTSNLDGKSNHGSNSMSGNSDDSKFPETPTDKENLGKVYVMCRSITRGASSIFSKSNEQRVKIEQSKIFASQALLYGIAYLATFLLPSVHVVIYLWVPSLATPQVFVPLAYMNAFFSTMQGFWNACIYVRPRVLAKRRKKQELKELERRREERRLRREQQQLQISDGSPSADPAANNGKFMDNVTPESSVGNSVSSGSNAAEEPSRPDSSSSTSCDVDVEVPQDNINNDIDNLPDIEDQVPPHSLKSNTSFL